MHRFLALCAMLCACKADPGPPASGGDSNDKIGQIGPYSVHIRWTSYGVPHIQAADYGSLGYGLGYALAKDHFCVLADQITMVRSERSRFFGADHVDTDMGWLALGVREQAEEGFETLKDDMQATLVGYAAGVNRYLEDTGVDGLPAACAGGEHIREIDHIDLLSYYLALGLAGSGKVFVNEVGNAQPPSRMVAPSTPLEPALDKLRRGTGLGSNGWAIGSERTESGAGMLLSNTHFPYTGERQWHEAHLTIPGELNVYGASLIGVPVINVGFNEHVAWTHTVSMTPRFILYMLEIDPYDPTRYRVDGEWLDMEARDFQIEVLQADGGVETVERTLYRTRYGPMANLDPLGWNTSFAFSFRDANANNLLMAGAWLAMNKATDLDSLVAAHEDPGGIPWVHTMATGSDGRVWYGDTASTPNWSAETEAAWRSYAETQYLAGLFADNGAYLADGSDTTFDWEEDERASLPGLVPFDLAPRAMRTDFVFNANDNHWLSNPAEPLEGYPMLYGSEATARSPRTRMNARYLAETGEGSASGADGHFTLEELEAAAIGGRGIVAEELLAEVVARCSGLSEVDIGGEIVDPSEVCGALAAWDGTVHPDSRGAVAWREFLGADWLAWADFKDEGDLFAEGFDADDPVDTPTGLVEAPEGSADPVLQALGRASRTLATAGLSPSVRLADAQFFRKGTSDVGMGGGHSFEGVIAIAEYSGGADGTLLAEPARAEVINSSTDLTVEGYQLNYGNSYVLTVEMLPSGPVARAAMSYSQSDDPASAHYTDQSVVYGGGSLRAVAFTEEDIANDPDLIELTLEHRGPYP